MPRMLFKFGIFSMLCLCISHKSHNSGHYFDFDGEVYFPGLEFVHYTDYDLFILRSYFSYARMIAIWIVKRK